MVVPAGQLELRLARGGFSCMAVQTEPSRLPGKKRSHGSSEGSNDLLRPARETSVPARELA